MSAWIWSTAIMTLVVITVVATSLYAIVSVLSHDPAVLDESTDQ